ncbi:hypothetical protein GCK72_009191 [Caenorhabditis remanei]|uniref:Uncharacterized protein n=1 Tax=Caenorhabditis remanei TaxID=31234 RepID=A0A6A5GZL8_CAERE|nr:hypothetical protein GCK72_009191 [Caenorhabditis remanei]KAF1760938.1 hypothetical protein GCK72_009191 [Caenorhabditis remanei]
MHLRSLVRVRLTKYFPSDRYVKNRCNGADGLLIDMERREGRVDDYKLASFMKLRDSKLALPKLLVDPVNHAHNSWIPRLIADKSIAGIAMRNLNSEDVESWDNTVFTMIWDTKERRITHSIISYHRINDGDIHWNSSIRTAVQGSLDHDIQPLAARILRFRDMDSATQEFEILRQIGFTGAVIRNPNLIEMTNKVFEK